MIQESPHTSKEKMSSYNNGQPPPSYEQSGGAGGDTKKGPLPPDQPQSHPPVGANASGKQPRFASRLNQIYLSWVPVAKGGQVPARAIEGRDSVGVFIARARQGYSLLPGKAARQLRGCHACHGGNEVIYPDYEVLCDSSIDAFGFAAYDWVPWADAAASAGPPPAQALAGGHLESGEPLFVARGSINGERVFGYFAASQRCASFPWGGREHRSCDFELLVTR